MSALPSAVAATAGAPLLEVRGLELELPVAGGTLHALRGVDLSLAAGRTLGIVGESGCGKSLTALSLLGLQPAAARRRAAALRVAGCDLLSTDEVTLARELRGRRAAMIFQEPMTSLNPVLTVGEQMIEVMAVHRLCSVSQARDRAVELLERVGIAGAAGRLAQYPHQFSGGQRQRIMIAMALMARPQLLIADEPTTALDVTVQAEILDLLAQLRDELGMALVLVTHNLGLVSRVADEVAVMYAGVVVEQAPARELFERPRHPYTRGLLAALPEADDAAVTTEGRSRRLGAIAGLVPSLLTPPAGCAFAPRCPLATAECGSAPPPQIAVTSDHQVRCLLPAAAPALLRQVVADTPASPGGSADAPRTVLRARGLVRRYSVSRGMFAPKRELVAVDHVDLDLQRGEVLAVVGESGCGKSTLARLLLGLETPDAGAVELALDVGGGADAARRRARFIQPVFQDPMASLNPRRSVAEAIRRPLDVHGLLDRAGREERVRELMQQVGLPPRLYHAFPAQLSGGQRQRVAIARALALDPQVLLCDEPTSALDVSVQAQILNLLADLREQRGLTLLLITHDLGVVRHMADRVLVMYLGRVAEVGRTRQVFEAPRHPYTRALVGAALPVAPGQGVPRPQMLPGFPNPLERPAGCAFAPRCPQAGDDCARAPALRSDRLGQIACHRAAPLPAVAG